MDLEVKNIEVNFSEKNLFVTNSYKLNPKETVETTANQIVKIDEQFVDVITQNQQINIINHFNALDLNVYHFIPDGTQPILNEEDQVVQEELYDFVQVIDGNLQFGIPLDVKNLVKVNENGVEVLTDYTQLGIDVLFKDFIYEFETDTEPLYTKNLSLYNMTLRIVKNNLGETYWPEFDFNGIGNTSQFEGYLIRTMQPLFFKTKGKVLQNINSISDYGSVYINGWNYVSYKTFTPITSTEFFADYVDQGKVLIVKNTDAEVYWVEFNFDGIGYMQPGESYLTKFENL